VPWEPQRPRHERAEHGGAIADDKQALYGPLTSPFDNRADGTVLIVETDWNRLVLPRIVELVTSIGGENEVNPRAFRDFAKRPRLISRRRRQQKDSGFHASLSP
jgi:hypothetical protein